MAKPAEQITIYYPTSLKRMSKTEAFDELVNKGSFKVFLSFIDPKSDCLIQDKFTFYPKPQISYMGKCFIAEYNGVVLRIPATMDWWAGHNNTVTVRQATTILVEGGYENIEFDVEVDRSLCVENEE